MSEDELDKVLAHICANPLLPTGWYADHSDAIEKLEARGFVSVTRVDIFYITDVKVTDNGRWFLAQGGFVREKRDSDIESDRLRREAEELKLMRVSQKHSTASLIIALLALVASIAIPLISHYLWKVD